MFRVPKTILSLFLSWCLACAGFPAAPCLAQAKKTYTIAVLDLNANGLPVSEAKSLSDYLRGTVSEMLASPEFPKRAKVLYGQALERSQMDKIFDQFNIQNTGCTDVSCAVELGKMLNVERILIGSVGLVGETYTIQSRIVDIESSAIVAVSNYSYRGERDNLLKSGIPKIANELFYGRKAASGKKKWYIIAGAAVIGGAAAAMSGGGGGSDGGDTGKVNVDVTFPE